jgi:hypothetical protein
MDRVIDGITLIETCSSCPEQYDAFDENKKQVGYLRLRHGNFTVECPDVWGKCIYEKEVEGYGDFIDEEEREKELTIAVNKIKEWLNNQNK